MKHQPQYAVSSPPRSRVLKLVTTLFVVALWGPAMFAYEAYSQDPNDNTGYCAACHGDFDGDPYTSLKDGEFWNDSLMSAHRFWVSNSCNACHQSPGSVPVSLSSSGNMILPKSCAGCHGRDRDAGTDTGQPVQFPRSQSGAGLRQRHYTSGYTVCADCHGDANPANFQTAGEDVDPFNYQTGALSPSFNADPCADNQVGPTGLDNDGDQVEDGGDPDCGAPSFTPGEVTLLLVTAHDPNTRQLAVNYTQACSVTDNTIEFGPLAQVSSYVYSGQECPIGNTGSYVWTYAPGSGSFFFLVVGNDSVNEGSYGKNSSMTERPEDTVNPTCNISQSLGNTCS